MKRHWQNGESDESIFQESDRSVPKRKQETFHICSVLEICERWRKIERGKTSKQHACGDSERSKTSEFNYTILDTRVGIHLNNDDTVDISPPSRPMGMDKTKSKDIDKSKNSDNLKMMGQNRAQCQD